MITVRAGDAPEIEAFLIERIIEFNAAASGHNDAESFTAVHRDDAGSIDGGACGYTWGGCCYVAYLWVIESRRRQGLGSEVLEAVERYARERKCKWIFLSTHSFQAPGFYARKGYEPVARIEDHPVGFASIFFAKRCPSSG